MRSGLCRRRLQPAEPAAFASCRHAPAARYMRGRKTLLHAQAKACGYDDPTAIAQAKACGYEPAKACGYEPAATSPRLRERDDEPETRRAAKVTSRARRLLENVVRLREQVLLGFRSCPVFQCQRFDS